MTPLETVGTIWHHMDACHYHFQVLPRPSATETTSYSSLLRKVPLKRASGLLPLSQPQRISDTDPDLALRSQWGFWAPEFKAVAGQSLGQVRTLGSCWTPVYFFWESPMTGRGPPSPRDPQIHSLGSPLPRPFFIIKVCSTPSLEPNAGFEFTIMRSRPARRSRVQCLTD